MKQTLIGRTTTVTVRELAGILGITPRWCRKLSYRGVVKRTGRNQYALAESVQGYIRHRETLAYEKGKREGLILDVDGLDLSGIGEQDPESEDTLDLGLSELTGWE